MTVFCARVWQASAGLAARGDLAIGMSIGAAATGKAPAATKRAIKNAFTAISFD
jgi:hypothetical protein